MSAHVREGSHTARAGQGSGYRYIVLVVEDDVALMRATVLALQGPYRVLSATSGKQAIEILKRCPVDAILLDLIMAEGDGYTVLGFVRSMDRRPVVIVNSVMHEVKHVVKAMQLGASDYVVKPTSVDSLRKAIHAAIDEAE